MPVLRRRLGAALIGGIATVALAGTSAPAAAADPWTPPPCQSDPQCIAMVAPLGAAAVNGYEYAFVKGADGNAWVHTYSVPDRTDEWSGMGRPPGTTIDAAVGAVTGGTHPRLFARTAGGVLWRASSNGLSWTWASHGRPPSVWLTRGYGAVAAGAAEYAFVQGSDGNLWSRSRTGGAWSWTNLGQPAGAGGIEAPVGTIVVANRPHVFVKGRDGNLWLQAWTGSAWGWSKQGRPSTGAVHAGYGAVTLTPESGAQRPFAFVTGVDGDLWSRSRNGTTWTWTKLGRPAGTGIHSPAGATVGDDTGPQVFVRGVDGQLWRRSPAGQTPAWTSLGRPPGTGINATYGAISDPADWGGTWTVFVKGGDGRLWYRGGAGTFLQDWYNRDFPRRSTGG